MRRLYSEAQPLAKVSWITFRRHLVKHLILLILIPLVLIFTSVGLNYSTFSSQKSLLRQDPAYEALDLRKSFAFELCQNETSVCKIGVSINSDTLGKGIWSSDEQMFIFRTWIPFFRNSIHDIPLSIFNSSKDLGSQYALDHQLFAGVVLDASTYPNELNYDIRLPSSMLSSPLTYNAPALALPPVSHMLGGSKSFASSGFAAIQVAVEESLINFVGAALKNSTNSSSLHHLLQLSILEKDSPKISLQVGAAQGPHSSLLIGNNLFVPCLLFVIGLESYLKFFGLGLTLERISGWKKWMKFLGMRPRAYWLVNGIRMIFTMLPILLLILILTIGAGFWHGKPMFESEGADRDLEGGNSPPILIALGASYIFLYVLCSISYATMVGIISGSVLAAGLWPVIFLVSPLFASATLTLPLPARLLFALIAPVNLILSIMEIFRRKIFAITGATDHTPAALAALCSYPIWASFVMFLVDIMLYFGIAIFVSYLRNKKANKIPPETNEQPDDVLQQSFILSSPVSYLSDNEALGPKLLDRVSYDSGRDSDELPLPAMQQSTRNPRHFEPRSEGERSEPVLHAIRVEKKEKDNEPTVPELDLEIDSGIYVFVGTGISEILELLCGYERPSSGRIDIYGHDIYSPWSPVQKATSYCPKANLLFDDLSVREHLEFVGHIRGIPDYDLNDRTNRLLKELLLGEVSEALAETLSAGQKRCLMLACSLLAPVRLLFLDDPSNGMNLEQRRATWRLLMRMRDIDDVSIIMTTSYMEDAEVLADRIGVVHKGKLIREGSLDFLMREVGVQLKTTSETVTVPHAPSSVSSAWTSATPSPIQRLVVSPSEGSSPHPFGSLASSLSSSSSSIPPLNTSSDTSPIDLSVPITSVAPPMNAINPISSGLRDEISLQILALEAQSEHVSIQYPSLEDYVTGILESFDVSCTIQDQDDDKKDRINANEASEWPTALSKPAPRNAPVIQQVRHYLGKTSLAGARNRPRLLCFIIFPIIVTLIAFATSRLPGQSLKDVPALLSKWQADPNVASEIAMAQSLPATIPFCSSPVDASFLLSPWSSDSFSPIGLGDEFELNNVLWRAKVPSQMVNGGVSFVSAGPSQFSFNVAYNFSEVYSPSRLINWVSNAVLVEVLKNQVGITLNSSITSPFIRLRSVPFVPRVSSVLFSKMGSLSNYNQSAMMPTVEILKGHELGFSFQVGTAIFIPAAIVAQSWTSELQLGLRAQLQRFGLGSLAYWISTYSWALARYMGSLVSILVCSAVWRFEFLSGVAFLFYSFSLLSTILVTISITAVLTRFTTNIATASSIVAQTLIFSSLLTGVIFGAISSALASVPILSNAFANIYFLVPTTLFGHMVERLAQSFIDNDFQRPDIGELFHSTWGLCLAQALHVIFWTIALVFIEYRRRRIEKEKEEIPDGDESVLDTHVAVSGGLPWNNPSESNRNYLGESNVMRDELIDDYVEDSEALKFTSVISARNLSLRYPQMPRRVVDGLNLSLTKGGSLCIIGPRASGKTSAASMILGERAVNSGFLGISGLSAIGSKKSPLFNASRLGSSFSKDQMLETLTVREQIELVLAIRNHSEDFDLRASTAAILKVSRLSPIAETKISSLDNGSIKKLSAALASLTFSETIVLDEPTYGCDLASRNVIWEMIRSANQHNGSSVLVFSSKVGEAAVLSSEMEIMVNGKIVSRGLVQQLEACCSQGYELKVWIGVGEELEREEHLVTLEEAGLIGMPSRYGPLQSSRVKLDKIIELLEENTLKPLMPAFFEVEVETAAKKRSICITYDVPRIEQISPVFDGLSRACQEGRVLDFKISQMSLASAYHRLARQQLDDYSRHVPCACCLSCHKS